MHRYGNSRKPNGAMGKKVRRAYANIQSTTRKRDILERNKGND
jgi:hypothetical protein